MPKPEHSTRDEAPLHELPRDPLSVFLFISFTGKELADLVRGLAISIPGFRTERLSDAERADAIADEIRAVPAVAAQVIDLLRKVYEFPALDFVDLTPDVAAELGALAIEQDAPVRILWRLLADPACEVRATAVPILEQFAKEMYGPIAESDVASPAGKRGVGRPKPAAGGESPAELARIRKRAERALAEVAALKHAGATLKEELRVARAAASEANRETGAARKAREAAERALAKTASAAPRVGSGTLKQARKEAENAKHHLAAAEERARVAEEERAALRHELDAVAARAAAQGTRLTGQEARPGGQRALPGDSAPDSDPALESLPTTWLLPRFGREFYDSIKGWEARIVRAVFKQAWLLAENHRHPSLRAIPLEGLPGYYRVRVATDVRLIYKRIEREVEILSVIDREDLDRYVKEAKTR